jgi:hypothetical protein
MRLIRDAQLGTRLHVVVALRDLVLSSVLASEHSSRYVASPVIATLNWDEPLIRTFLAAKIQRLPDELLMEPEQEPSVATWLGYGFAEEAGVSYDLETYLVRHMRLLPRDVVIMGNQLCALVRTAKQSGRTLSFDEIRTAVKQSAALCGREGLAIAANQLSAGLMPASPRGNAGSELSSDEVRSAGHGLFEYRRTIEERLLQALGPYAHRPLDRNALRQLRTDVHEQLGDSVDALSALWQNGLIGYLDDGREVFRRASEMDDLRLPPDREWYVVHAVLRALIDSRVGR